MFCFPLPDLWPTLPVVACRFSMGSLGFFFYAPSILGTHYFALSRTYYWHYVCVPAFEVLCVSLG